MSTYEIPNLMTQFNIDSAQQTWLLKYGNSINSSGGHGIFNGASFFGSDIQVNGHITASAFPKAGISSEGAEAQIKIGEQALIDGYTGVLASGDNSSVTNNGAINVSSYGFFVSGVDMDATNNGSIDANVGMYASNATYYHFQNDGEMTGAFGLVTEGSRGQMIVGDGGVIDVFDTAILIDSAAGDGNTVRNTGLIESSDVAISGGAGNEFIVNNDGVIKGSIHLGDGNDVFHNTTGTIDHAIDGGAGNDTYYLSNADDKIIDVSGNDTIATSISRSLASFGSIENLRLIGGNINGTGNGLANTIYGSGGNNILDGGSDNVVDFLLGGGGNDTYVLGSGSDKVDEVANPEAKSTGNGGIDTITSMISRNLTSYSLIENLKLLGSSNINGIGNALDNALTGNAGNNALSGGAGDDIISGGAGADNLSGGADTDTLDYRSSASGVKIDLTAQTASGGDAQGDTFSAFENISGSNFNDALYGDGGVNVLRGYLGNDTLDGRSGNDILYGYEGNDNLRGGNGDDRMLGMEGSDSLQGGAGADDLYGDLGADTFVFNLASDSTVALAGQDTVYDFSHAQGDRIDLGEIDAKATVSGDNAFIFKGTAAFTGTAGELRYIKDASETTVYGDVNGDKKVDFAIHFDAAITFVASDFFL